MNGFGVRSRRVKEDSSLDAMLCFHTSICVALAFLFSSVLPTSALTFEEECGPGYWVPHQ